MIRQIISRTIRVKKSKIIDIKPARICIFKIGAIGDVLMSTPMVHALRQRYPKSVIDYWTGSWSAKALKGNKDINRIFEFDDATFFKKRIDLVIALARQIAAQRYDAMFILDKHWSLATFGRLCNVRVRIGFDREGEGFAHTIAVPYGPVRHEVDYYLELAYRAGAKRVKQSKMEFALSQQEKKFASDFFAQHRLNPKKTIAVIAGGAKNPGQNMPIRRWPAEYFSILAQALAKEGWQIILIGKSPEDDDTLPFLLHAIPNAVNAVGNFTLQESAALMQKCRAVICNDSGPMHIAAAVGAPTISIFGATDPHRKAPRGSKHLWVWRPVECTRAEAFGIYNKPNLIKNILKVQPKHVLNAVHKLVRAK